MPKPKKVYDPMTGKLDRKQSSVKVPLGLLDVQRPPAEPLHQVLGISEHRLARVDGNIEKLSIRGTRIA